MKKSLLSLALLFSAAAISAPALATTGSLTKTGTAPTVDLLSTGTAPVALTSLIVVSTDFPSGTSSKTKTLTKVSYSAAAYTAATTESLQLCYYRPYTAAAAKCIDITPGSTSSTTDFNSYTFGNGSELQFRHTVTGAASAHLSPSRKESVTAEYSY